MRNQPHLGIVQLQRARGARGLIQAQGTNLPNVLSGMRCHLSITSHLAPRVRDKTVQPVEADISQPNS